MLVQQYAHRLPADYPMKSIHERIAIRAPLWAETPGLGFKAFALRHRGEGGAVANLYSSVYLWCDAGAARDYLMEGFAAVIDAFGRPAVETMLPLAVQVGGRADEARVLTRRDTLIGPDVDLRRLRADESETAAGAASRPGIVATVVALDTTSWRLTRYTLSREPVEMPDAIAYEIAHLACPGWARLEAGGGPQCR